MLEVAESAAQRPIEIDDNALEAFAARAFRLLSDAVLKAGQALLPDESPTGFEPITEEVEAFPGVPVANMGLVRMQAQAIVVDEGRILGRPPSRAMIEQLFAKLKAMLRKIAAYSLKKSAFTIDSLCKAIASCLHEISRSDCAAFLANSGYCQPNREAL
jgi:hypothetical protein